MEEILKDFGLKANRFAFRPPRYDARINILHGSVRSAKTWQMIPKMMYLCRYDIGGLRIITGVSKQTVYDNVLNDLFNVVGPNAYRYRKQTGELELFGTRWLVMGAKDEGSEKYLRGKTIGVAYCDELTLQPESFVMMLINRMSIKGARFYATTNPDSPAHYVKKKLLDNPKWRASGDVFSAHYTLNDNPNIPQEYKEFLQRTYTGVFRRRFILGEWVMAEGAIYRDCWSDEENIYDDTTRPPGLLLRGGYTDHFISCDYGTTHRHVYLEWYDDGVTLWLEREYVWDSKASMQKIVEADGRVTWVPDTSGAEDIIHVSIQKTDQQYADDLQAFMGANSDAQVIVPPEAASFQAEITARGIWHTDADNEVLDGIRVTASMMLQRRIKVHKRCACTIERIQIYAWDEKAGLKGEECPIKKNDDETDALRYGVKTKISGWRLLNA